MFLRSLPNVRVIEMSQLRIFRFCKSYDNMSHDSDDDPVLINHPLDYLTDVDQSLWYLIDEMRVM